MDRTIDYTPLFVPVARDEVVQFRTDATRVSAVGSAEQVRAIITWILGVVIAFTMVITVLVPMLVALGTLATGSGDLVDVVLLIPGIAIFAIGAVLGVRALRRSRGVWEQRLRMTRFALANGLVYEPRSPAPSYPGAIFGLGSSRAVTDHFRTAEGRFIDFGTYSYVTGSGKNRTTHRWGFLAMQLDRALPHMVLDSRANNGLFGSTTLPTTFRRDQVLSLEGDFDRYFTLYCPREYERDALYVFTPDLMALAIDEAAPFDLEIVDEWLFVYSTAPFPLADAATYQRLLRIVSTVGAKALSQTDRYVDERIGEFSANLVAPRGRRLERGFPWGVVAVGAVVVVFWVGQFALRSVF
ncbi:hypothetical protein [Microcella sp.]|uniref:hypothetical protein n=1 Tax=Microcella sp. TaxID=1913979 RepID=UPI00255F1244|nr:hypothetical protein [Microcella sp.]MBX9470605.1 DUF3137 domain-containing protein [Microcella sp.]